MRRRGFTLLELLVSITIIGLLAGLVLTALGRARQSGRATACVHNLRQIGLALQLYLDEHQGRLPALQNRDSLTNNLPALDTELVRYAAPGVFGCPADETGLFTRTGTSYFWNFTVNGQSPEAIFSIIGGSSSPQVPLVCDKEPFHSEPRPINTLYADGHADKGIRFSISPP